MHKKRYFIALGLSVVTFFCGLIYAMVSVTVTNHFETGIVDISLAEYQVTDDGEVLWKDNPTVLPGDVVSKIPRITNNGNDCYVRAKITFRDTDELDTSNLVGISDKWVAADDGYYYYTEILPHGKAVDLFEAVSIPSDFSQTAQGERFYIDIDADAIQSQNFTPEFNLASPWGSVDILKNEKGGYDVGTFKPSDTQSFQIVYQGDAGKLVKNADDFFANIPYLMPGDTYSDTVTLKNDGKDPIKLHFRSIAEDASQLLDLIQLKIVTQINGETVLFYDGSLRALDLAEDSIIGTIPKGAEGEFTFEIHVPGELNNEYSISASNVQWVFSTEVIDQVDNPKTGDTSNPLFFLGLMLISGTAMICLVAMPYVKKRKAVRNDRQHQPQSE